MSIYPLMMKPFFRHGEETPWGGNKLREMYGKDIPDDRTGESLEVSTLTGHESVVVNGKYAGWPLSQVAALWGEALTGRTDGAFPLLLKLLDARESLSVQVHPGDQYALAHEGKLGKNEAWYVLSAKPGAKLVYGLDTKGEPIDQIVREGRTEECLLWHDVHPGEVYYIPSGTVHALGAGIQCYEIQQTSDVTYRIWDWDRVDANGKPRQLDIEKALETISCTVLYKPCKETTIACKNGKQTYYFKDAYFEFFSLTLEGKMSLDSEKMRFLMPLTPVTLHWEKGSMEVKPYTSIVVPARIEGFSLEGDGDVLISSSL